MIPGIGTRDSSWSRSRKTGLDVHGKTTEIPGCDDLIRETFDKLFNSMHFGSLLKYNDGLYLETDSDNNKTICLSLMRSLQEATSNSI